jgi:excisionase family DNA binding protein
MPAQASVQAGAPEPPLLLRVPEVARLLGISRSAMYQLVASAQVPVVRIGRSIRVVRKGLEAWIDRTAATL